MVILMHVVIRRFRRSVLCRYVADVIRAPTHGGTHLDAPIHFHKGGWAVSEIPLQRLLFLPIALVDVRDKTALNSTYSLSVEDIQSWEEQHGRLPEGCLLFARTGWSKVSKRVLIIGCSVDTTLKTKTPPRVITILRFGLSEDLADATSQWGKSNSIKTASH